MNHSQAILVLRKGGTVEREGRLYTAGKNEHGQLAGGIFDVTDPENPEHHSWSDEERAAEDWQEHGVAPQVVAPEVVDTALTEQPPPADQ